MKVGREIPRTALLSVGKGSDGSSGHIRLTESGLEVKSGCAIQGNINSLSFNDLFYKVGVLVPTSWIVVRIQ